MGKGFLQERATGLDLFIRCLDVAVVLLAAFWSYRLVCAPQQCAAAMSLDTFARDHGIALVLAALLASLVFTGLGLYRSWRGAPMVSELRLLSGACLLAFGLLVSILYFTRALPDLEELWMAVWCLLSLALLLGSRLLIRSTLKAARSRGYNTRTVVLVGCGELAARLGEHLSDAPATGFRVLGFFDDRGTRHDPSLRLQWLGQFGDLADFVERRGVDQVWLALPLRAERVVRIVLHELRHSTADIRFVPDIFGFRLLNHSLSEVAGIPVVNLSRSPMVGLNRILKGLEDRVAALIILAVVSPLMLAITVAIKLTSPGPVFFTQLRHGWDGRPIRVYKFRSMKVHREAGSRVTQAHRDDARITPLGAFLRRTSLDELPQFINVLQGRMSIVGPRPHALAHNEEYKDQVERYMLRHRVKPGITGLAQVNGYRGETDTLEKMRKRVEYDLEYIEKWSLWLDLKIIGLTLVRGFVHRNAY